MSFKLYFTRIVIT